MLPVGSFEGVSFGAEGGLLGVEGALSELGGVLFIFDSFPAFDSFPTFEEVLLSFKLSWGVKDLLSLFKFSSIFKEATSFVSASLSASLFESEFSSFISFSSFEESSFEESAFSFNEISALLVY